ncbi:MAG: tyrosine-type recombinase/integrase [Acidimicrobiales bacterium]
MAARPIEQVPSERAEALEFDAGVRAYPPTADGGYWRLRWEEAGRRRDTTARSRHEAMAKAAELAERLGRGSPTDLARATGAELVAHYLDPARRPARVQHWSERHRDEQVRYTGSYVVPVIGAVACRRLSRLDFQAILDQAATASVAAHLRRCLTSLVAAGLEEGHLLARQDVLRGVRWRPGTEAAVEETGGAVTQAEIPTVAAVHDLARATAAHTKTWWRELEILFVAYSGLRWGEHVALSADRVDATRRRVSVDCQVVETRSALKQTLPKGRRRRVTVYPAATPAGVDLAGLVAARLAEVGPEGLMFPAPRGGWARRSNYGRNTWDPAASAATWPRRHDGRWAWTFHSLRHVFATWALAQPGLRIEDVSRLLGHSSIRVTQDIYVHIHDDAYDRFHEATV